MDKKEPVIKVRPPKPSWVENILKNSDKFEKEYKERTRNRILDVILQRNKDK
jgi:hypothetical protein